MAAWSLVIAFPSVLYGSHQCPGEQGFCLCFSQAATAVFTPSPIPSREPQTRKVWVVVKVTRSSLLCIWEQKALFSPAHGFLQLRDEKKAWLGEGIQAWRASGRPSQGFRVSWSRSTVARPHACNKGLSVVCSSWPPSPGSLPGLHFLLDSRLTSACPPWVLLERLELHFRIKGMKTRGRAPMRKATDSHLVETDGAALRIHGVAQ